MKLISGLLKMISFNYSKNLMDSRFFHTLLILAKEILGADITQTIFDTSILRIDRRSENPILDWHQDFPTNMSSLNAITYWIPLNNISPDQGQVRFVPNSNKKITSDNSKLSP